LSFHKPHNHVGIVTYGLAAIGLRTAHSFLPEFESGLSDKRLGIEDYACRLSKFYMEQWNKLMKGDYQGPNMSFVVAGFNEGEPYGRVYLFEIPTTPQPEERNPGMDSFGITWGGQREFVDRILSGYDHRLPQLITDALKLDEGQQKVLQQILSSMQMQVPLLFLPLQDCIDLAIFFIRTTISALSLTVGIRGVGGPIDVAIITRTSGLQFIQQKQIKGEQS
jgi:hypothetical protein